MGGYRTPLDDSGRSMAVDELARRPDPDGGGGAPIRTERTTEDANGAARPAATS